MLKPIYLAYFVPTLAALLIAIAIWIATPTSYDCGSIGRVEVTRLPSTITLDHQGKRYKGSFDVGELTWQNEGSAPSAGLPSGLTMGSINHQAVLRGGIASFGVPCNKIQ
jgi:hypothetical protein